MDWQKLDNKLNEKLNSKYVTCNEIDELHTVVEAVRELIDDQVTVKVIRAVRDCCRSVSTPRSRDDFINCLKLKLRFELVKALDEI